MLSTAQADPTPWLPLPEAADWLEGDAPPGTERASKYYRARYYDPKIGRFISEDPIGFEAGVNFYSYVGNNPINFTDPLGLQTEPMPLPNPRPAPPPPVMPRVPVTPRPTPLIAPGLVTTVAARALNIAGAVVTMVVGHLLDPPVASCPEIDDRCKEVRQGCIDECTPLLPTGTLDGAPFFRCLRECMERNGC